MAEKPGVMSQQAVAAAKRECNRRNASRARKRAKFTLIDLQQKADQLSVHASALQASNEKLQATLDAMKDQSTLIVRKQQVTKANMASMPAAAAAVTTSTSPSDLLWKLLLNSAMQQQLHFGVRIFGQFFVVVEQARLGADHPAPTVGGVLRI